MCDQHHATSCSGCGHALDRRGFLRGCGAAVVSGGLLAAASRPSAAEPARKARVGLVFLSNSSGREMWPYPDFDTTARENEIMAILREGCPAVRAIAPYWVIWYGWAIAIPLLARGVARAWESQQSRSR